MKYRNLLNKTKPKYYISDAGTNLIIKEVLSDGTIVLEDELKYKLILVDKEFIKNKAISKKIN